MRRRHDLLRKIPAVEAILEHPEVTELQQKLPRWLIVESARTILAEIREGISDGRITEEPKASELVKDVKRRAMRYSRRGIRQVINATGVVIHTNLGRSIMSQEAIAGIAEVAGSYSSLEFDLSLAQRTSRTIHVEDLLVKIVGCEGAFVVNNNAGAVLIALNILSEGQEAIVSRGELIEIGGSFRLPEVMRKSGAKMVEVGTTNRTRLRDYEQAISESTSVILKVHLSNFEMRGFVESASCRDLAELAHKHNLVLIEDLGSGALYDFSQIGIAKEPMPQESLGYGVDVVTFSGDKLMGGPQAGIIVGRRELIDRMKSNPLARALRVDKMTLAAMEETLKHYLEPHTLLDKLPTLKLLRSSPDELEQRAKAVAEGLSQELGEILDVSVEKTTAEVGGGSLPAQNLASCAVSISSNRHSADQIVSVLRDCQIPIIARIAEGKVLIDFRTVQPSEDDLLIEQIVAAFAGGDSR